MNQDKKKLLENFIRNEVRKSLKEAKDRSKLRSHDLWAELIEIIENNNNRPSYMSSNYSGQEIFNALNNLLTLIDKRWEK